MTSTLSRLFEVSPVVLRRLVFYVALCTFLDSFDLISLSSFNSLYILTTAIALVIVVFIDTYLRTFVFGVPGEFEVVDVAWSAVSIGVSSSFIFVAFELENVWILYLAPSSYFLTSLALIVLLDRYSKFEKSHALTATSILIDKGDSFDSAQFHLIFHEKLSMWLCPGGHIDDDRPPLFQLQEKIRSETGLEIDFASWLDLDLEDLNGLDFPKVVWATPPSFVLIEDLRPTGCSRGHAKHFDLIYVVFVRSAIAGTQGVKRYKDDSTLRLRVAECLNGRVQVQKAFELARISAGMPTRGQLTLDMAERLGRAAVTLKENSSLVYDNLGG